MSMSVRCDGCGLEYAGAKGLSGLFAQPSQLVRPRYLAMLAQVKLLPSPGRGRAGRAATTSRPCGEFLLAGRFTRYFADHFMLPLVAAVWSCGFDGAAELPRPVPVPLPGQPRHAHRHRVAAVADGDRRLADLRRAGGQEPLGGAHRDPGPGGHQTGRRRARSGTTPTRCTTPTGSSSRPIRIRRWPCSPTRPRTRRDCSAAFAYVPSHAVLHTDGSVLPRAPRARASWNYRMDDCSSDDDRVKISYDLKLLQRISDDDRLCRDAQRERRDRSRPGCSRR